MIKTSMESVRRFKRGVELVQHKSATQEKCNQGTKAGKKN